MAHDENHKIILLHKLIMNDLENISEIDHIKSERKFDNRLCNLRIVTRSQNCCNRGLLKSNTSGVTGVYFRKRDNVWVAEIYVNQKRTVLYYGKDMNAAIKARKEAEEKYYKEYSYKNSQKIYCERNKINV
jgi:hypothetical protein